MTMNISGENVKRLKLERSWTQEQLAAVTDLDVRTIQRVEKTGICNLETRAALAAVFEIDATQLDGTKKIEQAKKNDGQKQLYYNRLLKGNDVVTIFDGSHYYSFSNEEPRSADDAEYISCIISQIHDYSEIWSDIDPGSRVKETYEISKMLCEMEEKSLWLFGLRTMREILLPTRDGTGKTFNANIANFYIAYTDSNEIIVVNQNK